MAVFSIPALAATGGSGATEINREGMLSNPWAIAALTAFVMSYIAVLFEEQTHLRKSKPVMLGAGLVWVCYWHYGAGLRC